MRIQGQRSWANNGIPSSLRRERRIPERGKSIITVTRAVWAPPVPTCYQGSVPPAKCKGPGRKRGDIRTPGP